MKPARSKAHLSFIRSLPCVVSGRIWGVEAAHVGPHGMGQKASDFDTIPLNSLWHYEQHRVGLKQFSRTYDLDIPELLKMLTEKPRVQLYYFVTWEQNGGTRYYRWSAEYRGQLLMLGHQDQGLQHSLELLKEQMREILTEVILSRVKERMSR